MRNGTGYSRSSHHGFEGYAATLRALRLRSRRRGIWNRVLSRLERVQVDLTLRVVKSVKSPFLARVLESIMQKLESALESRVLRMIRSVGFPTALKLSRMAQSWGNQLARTWAQDSGFARFLAIMSLNSRQRKFASPA